MQVKYPGTCSARGSFGSGLGGFAPGTRPQGRAALMVYSRHIGCVSLSMRQTLPAEADPRSEDKAKGVLRVRIGEDSVKGDAVQGLGIPAQRLLRPLTVKASHLATRGV